MKRLIMFTAILGMWLVLTAAINRPYFRILSTGETNVLVNPPKDMNIFSITRFGGTDTVTVSIRHTNTDSTIFKLPPIGTFSWNFRKEDGVKIKSGTKRGVRVQKDTATIVWITGIYRN